ncbi:serine/threonine-protein phosphatase 2A activator 1 [Pyrenochaeta sp. MPI-SDFR-AT-0127]|nr:serine/threonine-protein phosphatase 2A activator 1 [Pyrenochaeta sp. MPI-SDFR-AT-0127]
MASSASAAPTLQLLDPTRGHNFTAPIKRINDGDDVTFFLASRAYADLMTFIFQLNTSMLPREITKEEQGTASAREWTLNDPRVPHATTTQNLAKLLDSVTAIIDEAPPDPGPRRFGNVSFRTWYAVVIERISALLDQYLPHEVLTFTSTSNVPVKIELEAYLVGSFGSPQRLDYGTGHELSFLAFLGCLWKLGAFPKSSDGDQERGIVLGVIEPYLALIRRLILTYTLEPAGSHGVWGLDDHSFLPYIFGSAQFSPPITNAADVVTTEGSLVDAPHPADVAKANTVERERRRNMYFSAIGFIYDVKKGPFWEHSPILYDISGVKAGWAKINKGMIKMYNAEVLSKFPVVQHFPFGSLFAWELDPNAKVVEASVHTSNQPKASFKSSTTPAARLQPILRDPIAEVSSMRMRGPSGTPTTAAPWTRVSSQEASSSKGSASTPWAAGSAATLVSSAPNQPTSELWATSASAPPPPKVGDAVAPWTHGRDKALVKDANAVPGTAQDVLSKAQAPWSGSKS